MSQLIVNRIASVLERDFGGKIDMSDWQSRPIEDAKSAFLSRALAALCIKNLASVNADIAGASITDGYGDGGIDAFYFDQSEDVLFFVQSKWSRDGSTPLNGDGSTKFLEGVTNFLSEKLDSFNDKIKNRAAEIRTALYSDRDVRLCLITAHNAAQPISSHVKRRIDDYIAALNNPVQVAHAIDMDQAGIYRMITSETQAKKINLDINLRDFGSIERPYLAYYGRVHVLEVAEWWKQHARDLFSRNLRQFIKSSDVNAALGKTIAEQPDNFWYFNNGITIICDTITKKLLGATKQELGIFRCENVSVVNGAQTVGTIGSSIPEPGERKGENDPVSDTWVQIRIISLENSVEGFDVRITQATNFQNAVSRRDFAAMDAVQHRLAIEFALDKRKYVYKSGEDDPRLEEGCSLTEATQALGCATSMDLAVQVKSNLSDLWASTTTTPYIQLFNTKTTSDQVWRAVLIMRGVDEEIQKMRKTAASRADMIGIHLNRAILNLVFQHQSIKNWRAPNLSDQECVAIAAGLVPHIFKGVADYIEEHHSSDYLALFCKNSAKCNRVADAIYSKKPIGQGSLFGDDVA